MLNKSGVSKVTLTSPKQILANVNLQSSVGCIVPTDLGVDIGSGTKIAKAGTPINIDLTNMQNAVKKPASTGGGSGSDPIPMNAVLLHDVDVTSGNANGTALIFGFVNLNRVEADISSAITAALKFGTPSALLTFIKA